MQTPPVVKSRFSRLLDATPVKGLLVGFAASTALDAISTALYEREDLRTRVTEDFARRNRPVYEVAVSQIAGIAGKRLNRRQERKLGWKFHQAFGLLTGLNYVALRRRSPRIGVGMGLLFGVGFFLVVDELLMPLLRWSPGPRAFPWKVHARGAVSHIAYGVAAEATARLLDRVSAAV